MEHSLGVCLVATGLGRVLGLDASAQSDVFYVSLLVMAGCTAHASEMAELLGDEVAIGQYFATVDRAGTSYDPETVACFCRVAPDLLAQLDTPSAWEAVLKAEPDPPLRVEGDGVDVALEAIAYFTDLKTPFTYGYSPGVARLAERAARTASGPSRLSRWVGMRNG